jgi:hypothetical protein
VGKLVGFEIVEFFDAVDVEDCRESIDISEIYVFYNKRILNELLTRENYE